MGLRNVLRNMAYKSVNHWCKIKNGCPEFFFNIFKELYFNDAHSSKKALVSKLKGWVKSLNKDTKLSLFLAVKNVNWEKAGLVDTWEGIADYYYHFDWGKQYCQYSQDWHTVKKIEFNKLLLKQVKDEVDKSGVNVFFSYLSGRWIFPETIRQINSLGVVTLNIGFDDSQSFWGDKEETGWSGNAQISKEYDLNITCQSPKDLLKYKLVGANAIYMPPGGNDKLFALYTPDKSKKIEISFIGMNYGNRGRMIEYIESNGVSIHKRGKGWPEGGATIEEMLQIYKESLITLGFGYVADTYKTSLKGRDFEVPLTGCAYMTSYNRELAKCFIPGEEIILYKNKKDLLNKLRYYLLNPGKVIELGMKGRERALREHKWQDRWQYVVSLARGDR